MIKSKGKTIAKDHIICNSLPKQLLGLMFSKKKNLIFVFDKERRISLHMLFVFFPIWTVYLSKNKEVVYKKRLLPFISVANPKIKAKYILELIDEPKIDIGDKISWV